MMVSVCTLGDPLSPSTWSGTPAAICQELNQRGILGETLNSAGSRLEYLSKVLSKAYYLGSIDPNRGVLARRHKARRVLRYSKGDAVLHLSTLDLPLDPRDKRRHYLFCDSTWNLYSRFAIEMGRYTPRMIRDAERLESISYQQLSHIFSTSQFVKDNLISHYQVNPEKITVVGTGRGKILPLNAPKLPSSTILFVAKNRFQEKGGPLLVEGFKRAYSQRPDLRLVIVGDELYREQLSQHPGIEAYGYVPWAELERLFYSAALFAMPAIYEPWGLVYLEALACRMPVLGLARNSLPELTQNGKFGFLVDSVDPDKVSDAILDAFSDPDRLLRMGQEGQTWCLDNFDWGKTVDRMLTVIQAGA